MNENSLGEQSSPVALSLAMLARVFMAQNQYDQAEPYLVRAVKIYETSPLQDDAYSLIPLSSLCNLYEVWGKPDKAEARQEAASIVERIYGPNSQFLIPVLTRQAASLRALNATRKLPKSRTALNPSRPPPLL